MPRARVYTACQDLPQGRYNARRLNISMRPGKRRVLDTSTLDGLTRERFEQFKASVRAKAEHPFRVIKLQFGYSKVRYRTLAKNAARLTTLFAFANLWKVRKLAIPMG